MRSRWRRFSCASPRIPTTRTRRSTTCWPAAAPKPTAPSPGCSRKQPPTCRRNTAVARKQVGKSPAATGSSTDALQARKDLTAMGLRYHDPKEFLDAVKRDDALAVELFIAGRGVNLAAKDAQGQTALEIARARGNGQMAQLLARNLPAAR